MIHTEALALQAKLHAAAQDLMTKATQVGATVSQVISEGRSELNEAEAALVAAFDTSGAAAAMAAKVKAFLESL